MLPEAFLRDVGALLGKDAVCFDADTLQHYGRDWTRVVEPAPGGVCFPRETGEVSGLLRFAQQHRVGIVPSGGRTGYAAGAVAARGELVVSLERMARMEAVDELGMTVRVQAGAVTEAVHGHVAGHGLTWPVDFASKGSSQVGGNIATNAGGVKVIRYGLTRQWVLGLQVVLAGGRVLELNGSLEKNNTGLDLRQLFIGSEGTLGIVTEATLKLTRRPGALQVMLFAVRDLPAVLQLFAAARQGPFRIMAYEFFTSQCLARLRRHRKVGAPFAQESSHYVLLEVEEFVAASLEKWVEGVFGQGLATDGVVASTQGQARELWTLREGISESLSATGLPHKNDIALPIAQLGGFCRELDGFFARDYPGWEICIFGHIGDGNLHVNVMQPDGMDKAEFLARTKQADHAMFALVKAHGGSISAEHGIGLLKKDYLGYTRTPPELELMRGVKQVLDPLGILNPGKIL